jgi:hypothetical protein
LAAERLVDSEPAEGEASDGEVLKAPKKPSAATLGSN